MAHDDLRTAPGVAARGSSDNADPYVVGIGSSAGGLAALRTLLGAMPRAPGFACVIVVHLAPHHESHLVELLQPYTRMRVQQVRETTRLEANNVYVIPPNANLEAIDTHLRLSPLESCSGRLATCFMQCRRCVPPTSRWRESSRRSRRPSWLRRGN